MPVRYVTFETAIGACGLVWGAAGIVGVQLPERTRAATIGRLLRRHVDACPATPPPDVQAVAGAITALLCGDRIELASAALDTAGVSAFDRSVYEVARTIPLGATATYGAIAGRIGAPAAAQAVGRALGRNPFAIIVPCHRVLAAGGRIGGFSAHGSIATKRRILAIEAAHRPGAPDAAQAELRFG